VGLHLARCLLYWPYAINFARKVLMRSIPWPIACFQNIRNVLQSQGLGAHTYTIKVLFITDVAHRESASARSAFFVLSSTQRCTINLVDFSSRERREYCIVTPPRVVLAPFGHVTFAALSFRW